MSTNILCRTCLKKLRAGNARSIKEEIKVNNKSIKDVIVACLPEINLGVPDNPVICQKCLNILSEFYQFKNECMIIEKSINLYKSLNNDCKDLKVLKEPDTAKPKNKILRDNTSRCNEKTDTNLNIEQLIINSIDEEFNYNTDITHNDTHEEGRLNQIYQCRELIVKVQKQDIVTCLYCNLSYSNNEMLNVHNRKKHKTCGLCSFFTNKQTKLEHHLKTVHINELEELLQQFEANLTFKCNICNITTTSKLELRNHRIQSHIKPKVNERYSCPYKNCAFTSNISYLVAKHIEGKHDNDLLNCPFCNYCTNLPYNIHKHINSHGRKRLKCILCSKTLKNVFSFKQHVKKIHPELENQFFRSVLDRNALKQYAAEFLLNSDISTVNLAQSQNMEEVVDLTTDEPNLIIDLEKEGNMVWSYSCCRSVLE